MKRMPNIRSVAERAGVSTASVSRYLNGKTVSPAAEKRILAAVQELGYAPSHVARSLKLRRTMTIGMVIPDITNPFFPAVVRGVEDTARQAGFALVLMNADEDADREWDCLRALQSQRCDGALLIIAARASVHARRHELQQLELPVVYLDRVPDFEADAVITDNRGSAQEAVRHLVRLGHTRIAVLTPKADVSVHRERVEGYRRALAEAGLAAPAEYEAHASPTGSDGYSAASALLALPERPSAVFVTSNILTIGAMAAIEGHGLACPDDISVVGYDNHAWQDVFHPRLTVVSQPAYAMGARAAELLISRINARHAGPPEQILLQSTLVVRESCGLYRKRREGQGPPVALVGDRQNS
jgi:LacI family transcriptional regulator